MVSRNDARCPAASATPADIPLPQYILDRNRAAESAGLLVECLERNGLSLTTAFKGSEESWRRSQFCVRDPSKPFPRSLGYGNFEFFSPSAWNGRESMNVRRLADGSLRGWIRDEALPEWSDVLDGGIDVHSFPHSNERNGLSVVYLGTSQALLKAGLITQEVLAGPGYERGPVTRPGYLGDMVYRLDKLKGGDRYIYTDYVGARERIACAVADRDKRDFGNVGEMISAWSRCVSQWNAVLIDEFQRVQTKTGQTYTVAADSMEAVREAMDELLEAIGGVRVSVRDTQAISPDTKSRLAAARADRAFETFLRGAGFDKTSERPNG
jgi:hypothetical protein